MKKVLKGIIIFFAFLLLTIPVVLIYWLFCPVYSKRLLEELELDKEERNV
jgi:hypothetical protein